MRYIQIPARPGELLSKIKTVIKHFISGGDIQEKVKMHLQLVKTMEFYRRNNLIAFRAYFIYILPYISKSFNVDQKHRILINHYSVLKQYFSQSQLEKLFTDGIECYNEINEEDNYSIYLQAVTNHLEFEGSMCLVFKYDNINLFTLNFTLVPGKVFNHSDAQMIYISSIQGVRNEFENIRKATKYFKDNSLPVILLKVLQAFAMSMGIDNCIGISVKDQLSVKDELMYDRFRTIYDDFWINNGGVSLSGGYLIDLPVRQKPIHLIAQPHRNRTLKKRKKLEDIYSYAIRNINTALQDKEDSCFDEQEMQFI